MVTSVKRQVTFTDYIKHNVEIIGDEINYRMNGNMENNCSKSFPQMPVVRTLERTHIFYETLKRLLTDPNNLEKHLKLHVLKSLLVNMPAKQFIRETELCINIIKFRYQ